MKTCTSAKDRNGKRITSGMRVRYLGCKSGQYFAIEPTPVTVTNIHQQGADGTILTCNSAPNPDYPHHFSCRASDTVVSDSVLPNQSCTCHPDDNPPRPCPKKYAYSECVKAEADFRRAFTENKYGELA